MTRRASSLPDAYTGGSDALKKSFEVAPKHRDEQYNAFCARELDYARGDDLLQIGRIDLTAARRYLLSEVPSGSLPALLGDLRRAGAATAGAAGHALDE